MDLIDLKQYGNQYGGLRTQLDPFQGVLQVSPHRTPVASSEQPAQ